MSFIFIYFMISLNFGNIKTKFFSLVSVKTYKKHQKKKKKNVVVSFVRLNFECKIKCKKF